MYSLVIFKPKREIEYALETLRAMLTELSYLVAIITYEKVSIKDKEHSNKNANTLKVFFSSFLCKNVFLHFLKNGS